MGGRDGVGEEDHSGVEVVRGIDHLQDDEDGVDALLHYGLQSCFPWLSAGLQLFPASSETS